MRFLSLLVALCTVSVAVAQGARFRDRGMLSDGAAEWVSRDEDRLVFGSQTEIVFARASDPPRLDFRVTLPQPAREAVFAGERLYWSTGSALYVLDVEHLDRGSVAVETVARGTALRVTRMDEYLVVLEEGFGIRILALPPPPGHRTPQHASHIGRLTVVAELPLSASFLAAGSSSRRVYLATKIGDLIVVNAQQPDAPFIERRIPLDGIEVQALAANGPRVWLLGREGLVILETSPDDGSPRIVGRFPAVVGQAIELAGRTLYLAAGSAGVRTLLDSQTRAVTHSVTVSNTVFTPNNLTINIGDTVQWNNVAGLHSVDACDGISDPAQCGGVLAAEGSFSSGPAANAPWTFSKTFNVVGNNPYFCSVHVGLGMTGRIVVQAPPAADHFVTVSSNVFSPSALTVNPGDIVQWDNVAGVHGVESCDGASDPAGCGGSTAVEGLFLLPGGPSSLPWTFQHTFTVVGANRYFCPVHVGLGMIGTVTTAAPAPPAVPDGGVGTPLTAIRLDPGGTELSVSFDGATCTGNTGHHLIFGFGSNLPASLVGTYDPVGGVCLIGGSPLTWTSAPDPSADPTHLLWFLMLADDGSTTEGSWSSNSAGERNGPGANGSSNQCSIATKDLTNSCGQ